MFGTSGVRGPVGEEVTADTALSLGRAVGSTYEGRIVVGRDARPSGEWLQSALVAGLRECGVDVVDVGTVATPTLARSVPRHDAAAGVIVTASHNPPRDNGFKFWTADGRAIGPERRRDLTNRVCSRQFDLQSWEGTGDLTTDDDARAAHRRAVVDATADVDSLTVVVDVGNGMGDVTVDALRALGCDVRTLDAEADGSFPARPSEPTADHCELLARTVASTGADLGVAHDGDADRAMAVTESGSFVAGDVLLALFGREAADNGDRVAAPVNTSLAVDEALDQVGASVTRTQVGDVHVAERASEDDVAFGGEPSGAWIWPDEAPCPDGALAACRLAALVDRRGSLDDLVDAVPRYPMRRVAVETDEKSELVRGVREQVSEAYDDADVTTTDGLHVETDEGWFLVRASGTQPLVRVTAQGETDAATDDLLDAATDLVERARPRATPE